MLHTYSRLLPPPKGWAGRDVALSKTSETSKHLSRHTRRASLSRCFSLIGGGGPLPVGVSFTRYTGPSGFLTGCSRWVLGQCGSADYCVFPG